jgi:hypothetical protein
MPDPTLYLTSDVELKSVADAIRAKGNTSAQLTYPSGFNTAIGNLPVGTDCNATASDIVSGKTAIVNRTKITGNVPVKSSTDVTVSGNTVSIPAGKYSSNVSKTVGTAKQAETYNTYSQNDRTIAAGTYLSGAQTIKAVTTSNIDAGYIKKGVTVKVGDANNAGRIKNVTGTYVGTEVYNGATSSTWAQISSNTGTWNSSTGKFENCNWSIGVMSSGPWEASRFHLQIAGLGVSGNWSGLGWSVTPNASNTGFTIYIHADFTPASGSMSSTMTLAFRLWYC